MLKIKDNVDLKELEKYGLQARYSQFDGSIIAFEQRRGYLFCDKVIDKLFLKAERKKIKWDLFGRRIYKIICNIPQNPNNNEIFLDTLYDLIKDGLVEKVED